MKADMLVALWIGALVAKKVDWLEADWAGLSVDSLAVALDMKMVDGLVACLAM